MWAGVEPTGRNGGIVRRSLGVDYLLTDITRMSPVGQPNASRRLIPGLQRVRKTVFLPTRVRQREGLLFAIVPSEESVKEERIPHHLWL